MTPQKSLLKALYGVLVLLVFFLPAFLLQAEVDGRWGRVVTLSGFLVAMAFLLFALWKAGASTRAVSLLVAAFATLSSFVVIEMGLVYFPKSHGITFSYSHRNWERRYFQVTNEWGFRDKPWKAADLVDKPFLLAIGDSHTAGAGIKDYEDRFQNVAGTLAHYPVVSLARPGFNTPDEIELIKDTALKPARVILGYCVNDIDVRRPLVASVPTEKPALYADVPVSLRPWIAQTYLGNFLYWSFPHVSFNSYLDNLSAASQNPQVLKDHLSALSQLIQTLNDRKIPLHAVVIPDVANLDFNRTQLDEVKALFERNHVPTIDVRLLAANLPEKERTVSSWDSHLSVKLHREIGEILAQQIASPSTSLN